MANVGIGQFQDTNLLFLVILLLFLGGGDLGGIFGGDSTSLLFLVILLLFLGGGNI